MFLSLRPGPSKGLSLFSIKACNSIQLVQQARRMHNHHMQLYLLGMHFPRNRHGWHPWCVFSASALALWPRERRQKTQMPFPQAGAFPVICLCFCHQEHLESILNPSVYQMVTRVAHLAQVTSMVCVTWPTPSDYLGQCWKKLFPSMSTENMTILRHPRPDHWGYMDYPWNRYK